MAKNDKIAIFEGNEIGRVSLDGEWYYVIEDVIKALTDSRDPKGYIKDLRRRDPVLSEGWGQIATPLPISTKGGKQNKNCANTENVFRIIQSIPSKKAEPFKRWLARMGKERLDEIEQPGKAIERAKGYYTAKGYTPQWIQNRTASIDARITFTDTLKKSGIKEGKDYAILTNEMYQSWSGYTATQYKDYKGLSTQDSLRDNMTPLELAATIFSETAATELIKESGAKGFFETKNKIHIAGKITKEAVEEIERKLGKRVVTHKNMKELNSPEVQKQLIQADEEENQGLSEFNKNLKKTFSENNPRLKDKRENEE